MATERKTARELIETGLSDTEKLISQKQYTLAMIKARQTLEYITRSLCRRNELPEGELIDMIDDLYRKGIVSRDSCTHFHKIRMLGDTAMQNGDNNAYNANNAYQLLSQEVFAYRSVYSQKPRKGGSSAARRSGGSAKKSASYSFEPFDLLKILIPILAIILLFSIFKLVTSDKKETKAAETTAAVETQLPDSTDAAESTAAETETEAPEPVVNMVYKTNADRVRIRNAPTTDGDIIVTLDKAGTQVDFVSVHDEQWSVINYNGAQAYIASRYITGEEVTE